MDQWVQKFEKKKMWDSSAGLQKVISLNQR